jgi:hypothetical protein
MKRWWAWVTVSVVVSGAGVWVYIAMQGDGPTAEKAPKTAVAPRDEPPKPEPKPELPAPTTFPAAVEWHSPYTYVDKDYRLFSRYDTDGDGLYDASEFEQFGTLRYNGRTKAGAPRIDSLPYKYRGTGLVSTSIKGGVRLQQLAMRGLSAREDTDKDGLADEWERHCFKSLKPEPYGDEDGDGFPNIIEWYRGTNPLMQDILNPRMKPAKLEDPPVPRTPWDIRWDVHSREFWKIQDRLWAKVQAAASKPKKVVKAGETPTFPEGIVWLTPTAYRDSLGRLFRRCNTDGDQLLDANEFMTLGTIRYDIKTRSKGTSLQLNRDGTPRFTKRKRKRGESKLFRMARRDLKPKEDTDKDGLADAWETFWFKDLKQGAYDDPDGDGFPNIIEWYRGTSPVEVDILEAWMKPAKLEDPPVPQTPWDIAWDVHSREFWKIQDRLPPKPVPPKRTATRWDTDADGMRDADEFMMYGTLRYNLRTCIHAPRIKSRPRGSKVFISTASRRYWKFREMAKGPLKPEDDTDKDGLPDVWEKHCFGDLKPGAYDDPDGDGFPNIIEWYRGTNPSKVDILDPSMKPAKLEDDPVPKKDWDIRWDFHSRRFWEIQDRLAAKAAKEKAKP